MTDSRDSAGSSPGLLKLDFKPTFFGQYYLIDRISKGGMSDIYLARTTGIAGFKKPVAIKKLLPEYSSKPRYVQRFVNEARTLAQLNHSNIVHIFDMGLIDREYYIVLEYIEGRNVANLLAKAKKMARPPSLEFSLHLFNELAKALAYFHGKKDTNGENLMMIHQDVNTFNVMISYEAEVKVIDFGIARILLDRSTWDGLPVAGKLLYFSPEQLKGDPVDRRVDIYGTGVFLYELLTGERFVEHQATIEDTVKLILKIDVQEKIRDHPRIPSVLKPILAKAMALKPDNRYAWIEEMVDDVRSVIKNGSLELDPSAFRTYVKALFRQEIEIDTARIRKLMSERASGDMKTSFATKRSSESGPEPGSPDHQAGAGHSHEQIGEESARFFGRSIGVKAGRTIFRHGDPGSAVYVIKKGIVRLSLDDGPVKLTIALLGEGEFFGETVLVGEKHRSCCARALEDCTLVRIEKETFLQLIPEGMPRRLVMKLVSKLRDVSMLLGGAVIEDTLYRLIYGLIFFYLRDSRQDECLVDLDELIALFRLEDKSQTKKYLGKLEALEIVRVGDDMVRIKNFEKLENLRRLFAGGGGFTLKF